MHSDGQYTHTLDEEDVMLMVVPVALEVKSKRVESYAFLDPGSKCTLVTEETAQQLAIPDKTRNIKFDGFHEQGATMLSRRVALTVKSCADTTSYRITGAYTVPKIVIGNRAKYEAFCPGTRWPYLKLVHLPAIDAARVTVLIGMDNADALICDRTYMRRPRPTTERNGGSGRIQNAVRVGVRRISVEGDKEERS